MPLPSGTFLRLHHHDLAAGIVALLSLQARYGGGAARLHFLRNETKQPAILVQDLAIARDKRTAVRFRW